MKNIRSPLLYLIALLIIISAFMLLDLVQAQSFQEPSQDFPLANVIAPLDTSDTSQTKIAVESGETTTLTVGRIGVVGNDYFMGLPGICLRETSEGVIGCREYWDWINPWTVSGNNIYRPSGRVGIGTNNPQEALDVGGGDMVGVERVTFKDDSYLMRAPFRMSITKGSTGPRPQGSLDYTYNLIYEEQPVADTGRQVCFLTDMRASGDFTYSECIVYALDGVWRLFEHGPGDCSGVMCLGW